MEAALLRVVIDPSHSWSKGLLSGRGKRRQRVHTLLSLIGTDGGIIVSV